MSGSKKFDDDPNTTGHEWDGIEEFDNPMPRWWLWVFYATIIWGIGYVIMYPAWPLIKTSTAGLSGWSSRGDLAQEMQARDDANAAINAKLAQTELTEIANDPELLTYATSAGGAVFRTWCAQCHGSGAAGVQASGYPNLLDDDWLWGGDMENIYLTVKHGIRNSDDDDARYSEMPAFGEMLEPEEISQVANFVMSMSGETPNDPSMVDAGAVVYEDNCSACHAEDGTGDMFQGAPNLADAIWLYGGDYDTIVETVTYSRFGVMPAWSTRLTEAQVRAVTTYVHGLGGGQ